ncbi:C2H2 type zinc-finger-domain-containing protein [Dichotomopilus funicola]|uniref:C2H2 type zinc-finger-domain-containing protein n=1 Tax=Dichotomopilus funicola TaxID=1934379 RepID=A0AAN6UUZ5_9PEZI|nr:C2H2 type zinc-finger-domain-containing protein [Dichotomopilus funicola]
MDGSDTATVASDEIPIVTPSPESLLQCRLCNLSFDTPGDKRQHAKSEWHVYQIRCRVAEPGTVVSPPDVKSGTRHSDRRLKRRQKQGFEPGELSEQSGPSDVLEENGDNDIDAEFSENDSLSEDDNEVEFIPEECLFCDSSSEDFASNVSHMHQAHSLLIPFQSSLVVDLQTVIWFLHMVIFRYRECICCGRRRRTVEAIQQHMTTKGHCRVEVTEETRGFYHPELSQHVDLRDKAAGLGSAVHHQEDGTLRLPSGKILSHRNSHIDTTISRRQPKPPAHPDTSTSLPEPTPHADNNSQSNPSDGGVTTTTLQPPQTQLQTQLGRLRAGDQLSLAHLSEAQQRSVLVARRKGVDEARRVERRSRGRADAVGNKVAVHTKYYKQEVPVYMGG